MGFLRELWLHWPHPRVSERVFVVVRLGVRGVWLFVRLLLATVCAAAPFAFTLASNPGVRDGTFAARADAAQSFVVTVFWLLLVILSVVMRDPVWSQRQLASIRGWRRTRMPRSIGGRHTTVAAPALGPARTLVDAALSRGWDFADTSSMLGAILIALLAMSHVCCRAKQNEAKTAFNAITEVEMAFFDDNSRCVASIRAR